MAKTIWIMSGETSGDIYGAGISRELKTLDPSLTVKGMGGQHMKAAGVDILVDSTELGVMGLIEVLKVYPMFKRIFNQLLAQVTEERPDAVVMIDYPGFNRRFGEKLHALGIPVIWYICPQVWAWKKWKIPTYARICTKMLVIFPFEKDVFKGTGLDTEFVGHPLVEELADAPRPAKRDEKQILLLPGSRMSEVGRLLGPMLETAIILQKQDPTLRFTIVTPRKSVKEVIDADLPSYRERCPELNVEVIDGVATDYMGGADAGIAASGTVTVQAALMGLPLVSTYKMHALTYAIASRLVKLDHFTMVNIVSRKEVYEEFLQKEVIPEDLAPALKRIMTGGERRAEQEADLQSVVELLGGKLPALRRAAQAILEVVEK